MEIMDNGLGLYPITYYFANISNEYLCKNTHLYEKYIYSIPEDYLSILITENNPNGNVLLSIDTDLEAKSFKVYLLSREHQSQGMELLYSSRSAPSVLNFLNKLDIEKAFSKKEEQREEKEKEPKIVTQEYYSSFDYVYWTPKGKTYHHSQHCPTLTNSCNILSGTISASKKKVACDKCLEMDY